MYDEILLPVDGSPVTEQMMPHVLGLAKWFDATVHVSFVVNTTRNNVGVVDGTVFDTFERESRRVVSKVEARGERRGIEAHDIVQRGAPYDVTLSHTAEHGTEAIVMATHGQTGVERILFGNTTERIVQAASVPVLTARVTEWSDRRGETAATTQPAETHRDIAGRARHRRWPPLG